MGERTKYAPGTFCWTDLATTDQDAAKQFYGQLFGWSAVDYPVGEGVVYSMMQVDGKDVGAISPQPQQQRDAGVPPVWNSYVSVESADAAADRAQKLGATVHAPAFDVMDVGRMAVLQDPTGAVFQVWEPKKHIGAMITNEPGTLCWTELTTSDLRAAESFYTGLVGWTPKRSDPAAGMEYTEMSNQGQTGVGMMPKPPQLPPHVPSFWMPYFMVANVDASADKAKQLGGKLMVPPQDIEKIGRFSVVADPQGAVFAIFTPASR